MIDWIENPLLDPGLRASDDDVPLRFHRALPGYAPTPLIDAPELAVEWGVGQVWLKFENDRFGLPAFKYLGVSWAARRLLGDPPYEDGLELVAATDGNHGRAVARVARQAGIGATILVPAGTVQARIDAIASEGAVVRVVDGSYDDAVRLSAELADERRLVLSDTSWPGYEQVPAWVIEGYATLFREVDEQGGGTPDVAVVPIGVGALAAAAVRHLAGRARLAGVEPTGAACVLESARAGELTEVPGPHGSIMAGLNAGLPSLGHAAPFGFGAYVVGILMTDHDVDGSPVPAEHLDHVALLRAERWPRRHGRAHGDGIGAQRDASAAGSEADHPLLEGEHLGRGPPALGALDRLLGCEESLGAIEYLVEGGTLARCLRRFPHRVPAFEGCVLLGEG